MPQASDAIAVVAGASERVVCVAIHYRLVAVDTASRRVLRRRDLPYSPKRTLVADERTGSDCGAAAGSEVPTRLDVAGAERMSQCRQRRRACHSTGMMLATDVLHVLDVLAAAAARVWVDGGWGVDALLGQVTREHSDLDLVVCAPDLAVVRSALSTIGFGEVLRDWLPTSLALADACGHEVDLHPIAPTADGGGDQQLSDVEAFHYPPPVPGFIGGRRVLCVDAHTQVLCHVGYEWTDKDRQDMDRLADRFRQGPSAPDAQS